MSLVTSLDTPPPMDLESKGTLDELRQRNAELAEAVAARDAFIAVAGHELRNPMTPILGQIELLLTRVSAGKYSMAQVEQRLEHVQHAMQRYMKRAATLLDVSRITGGKLKLEPETFDLAVLLREVSAEFTDAARHAGVTISLAAPQTLSVTANRLATEQIIDNLISNALKYGNATPVEIAAVAVGDEVRIKVRDHGGGIAPEHRERVFGSFERAVGPGERQGGFGVGLWVVRQFVDAMRGGIAIGDVPGGGALFTVTLPGHMKVSVGE